MSSHTLPIPTFFDPNSVQTVWPVNYNDRQADALKWAKDNDIQPASKDTLRIAFMPIDVQNTFCTPGYELVVGGAVDDNRRLSEFVYRNLGVITQIFPTLDTHTSMQIFHPIFVVDEHGNPAPPMTMIGPDDLKNGSWKVNPAVAWALQSGNWSALQRHLEHYVSELSKAGKYDLTIWPYHAMLGSSGHALVSAVEEAIFFHGIARGSQPGFQIKGANPFTENYSIVGPEVTVGVGGSPIAERNSDFVKVLLDHDVVIIAGQAKSHCVAWTIDDLLTDINASDPELAKKVYLLEDCPSPVVVPGIVDFTDLANEAFERFRAAGMHIVQSTDPIESWDGINL
jgi:nicotinamidase-related amidase